MRVESSDRQRLVLRDRPWFLAGIVLLMAGACLFEVVINTNGYSPGMRLFLACLGLGVGWVAWRFMPFQDIVFDRAAGTMTQTVKRIGKTTVHVLPLDAIHRIRHESERSSESNARMYRLVLETERGNWPLSAGFTGWRHDETETAIRDWLTTPD